jgi:CO/xanthine dehydrogenase FAD-binding subunit
MILEYHRPQSIQRALELMARSSPTTVPLGGGTVLNRPSSQAFAVVDLQALADQPDSILGQLKLSGSSMTIGAAVRLQNLLEWDASPLFLKNVLKYEGSHNLRQIATLGGTLVAADGHSGFAAAMLALDPTLTVLRVNQQAQEISYGELLALRHQTMTGLLILSVSISAQPKFAYQSVSRTPADFPIVGAAVAVWPSGRTRVVLTGYGNSPILVVDGPEAGGVDIAAREAYSHAEDEWASAGYRSAMAQTLVLRCLEKISNQIESLPDEIKGN